MEKQLTVMEIAMENDDSCWCVPRDCWNWFKYSQYTSFTRETCYPVSTIIANPVLAWFNILGKIALLLYLIYVFVTERLYYKLSIPKVHVDYWSEKDNTAYNADDFYYCNNETYDFIYSPDWAYSDPLCIPLVYGESYMKGQSKFFFVPTFIQKTTKAIRKNCDENDDIFGYLGLAYENCSFTTDGNDTICDCTTDRNYIVMGAEEVSLLFSLSYYVSETGKGGITGDSDLRVVVKGNDGNVIDKLSDDTWINYTVGEWLAGAGISLDQRNPSVTNVDGVKPRTNPFYRTTGVNVVVDVQFYNLPKLHGVNEWSWKNVAVINLRYEPGWADMGSQVTYHDYPDYEVLNNNDTVEYYYTDAYPYGVKFFFLGSGYIGELDRHTIQDYFISSIVLLAVIPTIVAKLGMLLFGFNSEIYREQLNQHPDGMIRDMQHYFETFKFLFGDYIEVKGNNSKFCKCLSLNFCDFICPDNAGSDSSGEQVSALAFARFCTDRKIEKHKMYKMWEEINNDPYLTKQKSFTSKTLWKAVRNNYDAVCQRLEEVDVDTTLIREMWREWDKEWHTRKMQESYQDVLNSTNSLCNDVVELMNNATPSIIEYHGTRGRVKL